MLILVLRPLSPILAKNYISISLFINVIKQQIILSPSELEVFNHLFQILVPVLSDDTIANLPPTLSTSGLARVNTK
jgi:hypothetical protein